MTFLGSPHFLLSPPITFLFCLVVFPLLSSPLLHSSSLVVPLGPLLDSPPLIGSSSLLVSSSPRFLGSRLLGSPILGSPLCHTCPAVGDRDPPLRRGRSRRGPVGLATSFLTAVLLVILLAAAVLAAVLLIFPLAAVLSSPRYSSSSSAWSQPSLPRTSSSHISPLSSSTWSPCRDPACGGYSRRGRTRRSPVLAAVCLVDCLHGRVSACLVVRLPRRMRCIMAAALLVVWTYSWR